MERKTERLGEKTVEGRVVGRNKTVIPPDEVYKLAQIGCKDHEIAEWFGIDENTLRYNFSVELIKGRESLKQSLRRAQLKLALAGNATMLIWLGKNILGQSENPQTTSSTILPFNDDEIDETTNKMVNELDDIDAAE